MVSKEAAGAGGPRYHLARQHASALLALRRYETPLNLEQIIETLEVPVVERQLPADVRGTIGEIGGRRAIILNRLWSFSSEAERRWVLAEELGHVLLDHRLAESTAPGRPRIGMLEWQRGIYEREAKAFAAELLMPLRKVRERWLAESSEIGRVMGEEARRQALERVIHKLAREFEVTGSAMRVRLEQLKLI